MAKQTDTVSAHVCAVTAGLVDLAAYEAVDGAWRALKIGAPARRALVDAGYTELAQLTGVSHKKLAALHGMGPKALRILAEHMALSGAAFAP
ncbi:MAG: hypothetical protein RLZZ297_165 [Chloroflexota bacterium]|jgi:hypothetical protein